MPRPRLSAEQQSPIPRTLGYRPLEYPTVQFTIRLSERKMSTIRAHLVGKWARICKIFLFGAGLSSVNPRSPDVCSARPGLLQTSDNLDSAIWTESTPRGTPNGNILHIWAEKTTTCRRGTRKGTPEPKNAAPRTQARTPKHRSADPYGRPPTRVEQNCHALDKSIRPQAKDGPIQAES